MNVFLYEDPLRFNSTMKRQIVLASRNVHKIEELKLLLDTAPFDFVNLSDYPNAPSVDEDETTLMGNAALKALSAQQHTGLSAIGDDTGLFIEALDGKPGVLSARFAGDYATGADNCQLVLELLKHESYRAAKFVTVLALAHSDGISYFEGHLNGKISMSVMSSHGFGYEPIFIPDGLNVSMAQLSRQQKNTISHRAESAKSLLGFLDTVKV